MADFVVDVGFSSEQLNAAMGGVGSPTGAPGGTGTGNNELRVFGVVDILSILNSLKIVTDTIGFIMSVISTGISYLLYLFMQYVVPFFGKADTFFIGLIIDLANMFVTAIEISTNLIVAALNKLIPGERFDIPAVEFGRFRKDIIVGAYEDMIDTVQDQESSVSEMTDSVVNFAKSFVDGFLTNEEYAAFLTEQSESSFGAMISSIGGVESLGVAIQNKTNEAIDFINSIKIGGTGTRTRRIPNAATKYDLKTGAEFTKEQYDLNLKFQKYFG